MRKQRFSEVVEEIPPTMHKCANPKCDVMIPNWDKRIYHHNNCKQAVYDQRKAAETLQERSLRAKTREYRRALKDLQTIGIQPTEENIKRFENQFLYCKRLLTEIVVLENEVER